MKKNNKRGFTLAELLIVVAIIAVLTAIAIPVFSSQLEKSREATDLANIRSAYAALVSEYLTADSTFAGKSIAVAAKQTQDNWSNGTANEYIGTDLGSASGTVEVPVVKAPNNYYVNISPTGAVTVTTSATYA